VVADGRAPLVRAGVVDRVGKAGRVRLQQGHVLIDERTRVVR
jgi:hypothetical protein